MIRTTQPRPSLSALPDRRAPALHRTFPTWARQVRDDGQIEWRIYVPHRLGGALFMAVPFDATASRSAVAAKLREYRKVLWGRDKVIGVAETSAPASPANPASSPDGDQQPAELKGTAQGALF